MSIDKIKERIRMIEENDFNLNEGIHDITQTQADQITNNMSQNDRRYLLRTVGSSDAAYERMRDLANKHFDKPSIFNIGKGGDEVDIPKKDINNLISIYKILKTRNILTGEIDHGSFDATNGYVAINNIIKSMKGGDIQLEYDNDQFNILKCIYVNCPTSINTKVIPNNVNDAYSDIQKLNFVNNAEMSTRKRIKFKIPIK